MPFIVSISEQKHHPLFYIIHEASSYAGTHSISIDLAKQSVQSGKKVLLFDALLGLKNINIQNKNRKKIPAVLHGLLPLTELITQHDNIDVITGHAQTNINALPIINQNRLKNDLLLLAQSYDIILIDASSHLTTALFNDLGENIWVTQPNRTDILRTLQKITLAQTPHLFLNIADSDSEFNQLYLFIKTLCPHCKISTKSI